MIYLLRSLFLALVICSVNTSYSGDVEDWQSDKKRKFDTTGHVKAKGLEMTISYPQSWLAKEGERSDIVQKFVSDNGRGLETLMITVKSIGLPADYTLSEAEIKDLYSNESLKNYAPSAATNVKVQATKIEGIPAGLIEFDLAMERVGQHIYTSNYMFTFYYKGLLITLSGVVASTSSEASTVSRMSLYKPLFGLMVNSILLPKK